jgi:hypothetical protein
MQAMTAMYDYCYAFKSDILPVLNGEKDKMNEVYQKAVDSINALDNKITKSKGDKTNDDKQPEQNTPVDTGDQSAKTGNATPTGDQGADTGSATPGGTNQTTRLHNAADIASALDYYFNEDGIKVTSTPANPGDSSNNSGTKSIVNNSDHDKRMQIASDYDKDTRDSTAANDKVTDEIIKMVKTYYDNFFGLLKDYIAARITCAEGAYRDYMKFIRWHVGQYVGNVDKGEKNAGTNIDTSAAKAEEQKETDQHKIK